MDKILIITSSYDKTCDYIVNKYRDVEFFRFNLDLFSEYSVSYTKNGFEIKSGDACLNEANCQSIYYRKPAPENLNDIFDYKYQSFALKEARSLVDGIVESFDGICLTKPSVMRPAGNKILQAKLALKVGFLIPEFLITNEPHRVEKYQTQETIVKPLSVGVIQGAEEKEFVQTNLLDTSIELDALRYSPAYFQHFQAKDYEVRATFVGEEAFTVKIQSKNEVDWRKSNNEIAYSITAMPADIYSKCLNFMAQCKMEFGCFDFIVKNNQWYFLEMNVNGQWAWLEFETGLDISGSIVRYLNGN